jgi:DNA-cytosine methyltransferase
VDARGVGGVNVLSLFDGISCGQVALQRAGIPVTRYLASEIEKHPITITQHNWPATVQLGDVVAVRQMVQLGMLPAIDLLIGGSPCQGFSNAGRGAGFADPRSQLFFEYVRIKALLKPRWFLLENVKMKKADMDIISFWLEVEPAFINSADFSAQNRQRYYWTNIPISPWSDRGILLRDILQHLPTDGKGETVRKRTRFNAPAGFPFIRLNTKGEMKSGIDKAGCLTAGGHSAGNHSDMDIIHCDDFTRRYSVTEWERLQTLPDDYTLVKRYKVNRTPSREVMWSDGKGNGSKGTCKNITDADKSNCLTTINDRWNNAGLVQFEDFCRYLTPIEYERLQTLPDDYTQVVPDSARYKALGNGWTVDVIAHILKGIAQ